MERKPVIWNPLYRITPDITLFYARRGIGQFINTISWVEGYGSIANFLRRNENFLEPKHAFVEKLTSLAVDISARGYEGLLEIGEELAAKVSTTVNWPNWLKSYHGRLIPNIRTLIPKEDVVTKALLRSSTGMGYLGPFSLLEYVFSLDRTNALDTSTRLILVENLKAEHITWFNGQYQEFEYPQAQINGFFPELQPIPIQLSVSTSA